MQYIHFGGEGKIYNILCNCFTINTALSLKKHTDLDSVLWVSTKLNIFKCTNWMSWSQLQPLWKVCLLFMSQWWTVQRFKGRVWKSVKSSSSFLEERRGRHYSDKILILLVWNHSNKRGTAAFRYAKFGSNAST